MLIIFDLASIDAADICRQPLEIIETYRLPKECDLWPLESND